MVPRGWGAGGSFGPVQNFVSYFHKEYKISSMACLSFFYIHTDLKTIIKVPPYGKVTEIVDLFGGNFVFEKCPGGSFTLLGS